MNINEYISHEQFEHFIARPTNQLIAYHPHPTPNPHPHAHIRLLRILISNQFDIANVMINILQSPADETCCVYKNRSYGQWTKFIDLVGSDSGLTSTPSCLFIALTSRSEHNEIPCLTTVWSLSKPLVSLVQKPKYLFSCLNCHLGKHTKSNISTDTKKFDHCWYSFSVKLAFNCKLNTGKTHLLYFTMISTVDLLRKRTLVLYVALCEL